LLEESEGESAYIRNATKTGEVNERDKELNAGLHRVVLLVLEVC
jgi:hypothetical protein